MDFQNRTGLLCYSTVLQKKPLPASRLTGTKAFLCKRVIIRNVLGFIGPSGIGHELRELVKNLDNAVEYAMTMCKTLPEDEKSYLIADISWVLRKTAVLKKCCTNIPIIHARLDVITERGERFPCKESLPVLYDGTTPVAGCESGKITLLHSAYLLREFLSTLFDVPIIDSETDELGNDPICYFSKINFDTNIVLDKPLIVQYVKKLNANLKEMTRENCAKLFENLSPKIGILELLINSNISLDTLLHNTDSIVTYHF